MKNNFTYVEHVLEAIEKIELYLKGLTLETFSQNDMIFDAVVREIMIIGEASNRITDDFQKQYTDIPWHKVISMRNVLIHDYFEVDKELVWETCKKNLPELKNIFVKILESRS